MRFFCARDVAFGQHGRRGGPKKPHCSDPANATCGRNRLRPRHLQKNTQAAPAWHALCFSKNIFGKGESLVVNVGEALPADFDIHTALFGTATDGLVRGAAQGFRFKGGER